MANIKESKSGDVQATDALAELEAMGCKIHWFRDGELELPESFDLSAFPEAKRESVSGILTTLSNYVQTPAIEDWFEHHSDRSKWRSVIEPRLCRVVIEENRLTTSSINGAFLLLEVLGKHTVSWDSRSDKLEKIVGQASQMRSLLRSKHWEAKNTVEYVNTASELAFETLQLFSADEG